MSRAKIHFFRKYSEDWERTILLTVYVLVGFTAMSDSENNNCAAILIDTVDNSVISDTNPVVALRTA